MIDPLMKSRAMLGIQFVASYLPTIHINNLDQADRLGVDRDFVEKKIGVSNLLRFEKEETVVNSCVKAFEKLDQKENVNLEEIECIVLCTQNPDMGGLPHNSAIIHSELRLSEDCACFDISLGCSGYVYALSVIQSFMSANGMKKGLLFTCDPYSRILDPNDKNTSLLFGDAASVTFISDTPNYILSGAKFSTKGAGSTALCKKNGVLEMNGRAVFNFALHEVPLQIQSLLKKQEIEINDIDLFLLHQGSRFMIENIIKRAVLPREKTPIALSETGNTVSSSIPLLLEVEINKKPGAILMSGFGVGLSWATAIYQKTH